MTTVVANHEGMAADTRVVVGEAVFTEMAKKITRVKGHVLGIAGGMSAAEECVTYCRHTDNVDLLDFLTVYDGERGFNMLVKAPDGRLYRYEGHGKPVLCPEGIAAIGTGEQFALGALHAGATLRQAMKIAMKLDTKTGGRISVFKC